MNGQLKSDIKHLQMRYEKDLNIWKSNFTQVEKTIEELRKI